MVATASAGPATTVVTVATAAIQGAEIACYTSYSQGYVSIAQPLKRGRCVKNPEVY